MPTRMLVTLHKETTLLEEAEVIVEVPDDLPDESMELAAEKLAWDALRAGQSRWKEIDSEGSEVFVDVQVMMDEYDEGGDDE